jgi:hypothetical protein
MENLLQIADYRSNKYHGEFGKNFFGKDINIVGWGKLGY